MINIKLLGIYLEDLVVEVTATFANMIAMMKRPISGGFLVALEGIDGAGKTSISTLLAQWCGENGISCMLSKEPTGNKWGKELRSSANSGRLTVQRELELLELDRKDHVANAIQPALEEDSVVILDRYYWSTAAYQGSVEGQDYETIISQNEIFAPRPDLVIFLDIEPKVGLQRISNRGDTPNHFETIESLDKARSIFSKLASSETYSITVDATKPLSEVGKDCINYFLSRAMNKISSTDGVTPQAINNTLQLFGGDSLDSEAIA